jgi:hypothetical protein
MGLERLLVDPHDVAILVLPPSSHKLVDEEALSLDVGPLQLDIVGTQSATVSRAVVRARRGAAAMSLICLIMAAVDAETAVQKTRSCWERARDGSPGGRLRRFDSSDRVGRG